MTDSKKKTNGKNVPFGVWMPPEKLRAFDEKAAMFGISRNELVQRCAEGNVIIVNTDDLLWSIEQLREMYNDYDSYLERFHELADEILKQGDCEHRALLEMILDECRHLESSKKSMQTMETDINEILKSMRDAPEGANSINR